MAKILILGAGAMGSAFSVPLLERQHEVMIAGTHLEDAFIDEMKNNNNFHPGLKLHLSEKTNIIKYMNLSKELRKNPDLIVLGISSKGINWVVDQLGAFFNDGTLPPILMLTKGLSIHENKYELLVDKLERLLISKGFKNTNISAVAGPCLANGLANKVHTSVVFANKNLRTVEWLKDILTTDYYHPSISDDMTGIEVCAAIKNIFSMVIGFSKGLYDEVAEDELKENNYLNTSASLISQSLYEMGLFVNFLKGNEKTVYGLAGLGDLFVSSQGGRNSKMGEYMSKGCVYSEVKKSKMQTVTVEGAELVFEIGANIKKDFSIKKMPLLIGMVDAILDDKKFEINWRYFH